ncbi:MAG: hypothetical protein KJ668_07060, partial [Proteobacteria bacterium]|nr:hypothetical protein [Pseudomonadota bacterium]
MNLKLLNNEFQVSENPGLDTLDPRFSDIAGRVQEGDFSSAAAQAQSIIEAGIYDIRIICYFLYGFFDETGPESFKDIFNAMGMIFRENWESIGPLKNKIKHTKNSFNWFFKQAYKILESENKKKGDKWQAWIENTSAGAIGEALKISQALQQDIRNVLEEQSAAVVDGMIKTTTWLDSFFHLVYQEPEVQETVESNADDSPKPDNKKEHQPSQIDAESGPEDSTQFKEPYQMQEGWQSYPLQLLLKKMDVFERLVKENKTTGAALVANDINQIINHFDPQIYFPNLFSKFTRQFAINTEKLLAFNGCHDTAVWQSMEKLYHVDMKSFVDLENGFHFKS